jgi:hypothetical protein
MPFGRQALDQPGGGGDRRRPSQPFKPFATPGPTPLPTPLPTPAPIPLTHKKLPSGAISAKGEADTAAGEIPPVKKRPTPGPATSLALEPTVQVKLNPDGTPVEMPPARRMTPTPAPTLAASFAALSEPPPAELPLPREVLPEALSEPPPRQIVPSEPPPREAPPAELPPLRERLPDVLTEPPPREASRPVARAGKTPIPSRVTPAAAFNAVEADFFAREADLYKRETVETFDDLDSGGGHEPRTPSPKSRRKRK